SPLRAPPASSPQVPHVDCHHAWIGSGRLLYLRLRIVDRTLIGGPHHQRVDFDVLYSCTMVEKETPERERGGFERRAIGCGLSAKAGQTLRQLETIDHGAHLTGGPPKQAQPPPPHGPAQHPARTHPPRRA